MRPAELVPGSAGTASGSTNNELVLDPGEP